MAQIQTNAGGFSAPTVFAPVRSGDDGRRRQRTLLGLAIVGVAAVAMGGLVYGRASNVPAIVNGVAAQRPALEAYAPGGSVYHQQVPALATAGGSVYAPGGSVYHQQIPALATGGGSVYAPGGSVYEQQVP